MTNEEISALRSSLAALIASGHLDLDAADVRDPTGRPYPDDGGKG